MGVKELGDSPSYPSFAMSLPMLSENLLRLFKAHSLLQSLPQQQNDYDSQ